MNEYLPNADLVQKGFRVLQPLLAGEVAMELIRVYKDDWWTEGVLKVLNERNWDLPRSGSYDELVDSLDMANCLRLLDWNWNTIFRNVLDMDCRTWAKELMGIRNDLAHIGGKDFSVEDSWRALDTMARLCHAFDGEGAEEIRNIQKQLRADYAASLGLVGVTEDKDEALQVVELPASGDLPSWRKVMRPHEDVCKGELKTAEFAADLDAVAHGTARPEYQDPVEFFQRTYVTAGMKGLLVQALERLSGKSGDPVIQLKTAFGGGKTHTLLALYHLMRSSEKVKHLPGVAEVFSAAGVTACPAAHVAVLVGTTLNPSATRRPVKYPGITIRTLWGEMTAQLAWGAGKPELYDLIKEADRTGTSPGSSTLRQILDECGPSVILIDELVLYARKLYGQEQRLPAGTFDNVLSFVQELTEAAKLSRNSLVVASLPESEIELGDEGGKKALQSLEHTFARVESVWKPVDASEGFEVVRRRLFEDCADPAMREAVCQAFAKMYRENSGDFPLDAREAGYKARLLSCYPIHPEVFDDLYDKWSTLRAFQRTRGVLRFMAEVIHKLWIANDASPMILPGSMPMYQPKVRDELSRYMEDELQWNAIIDKEVDGADSTPAQLEKGNPRYADGHLCRRLTRTIFLGSAPSSPKQAVRGIDKNHIRLGSVQPGDNIAAFNDALNTLRGELTYLYANKDLFYYDTRPTLQKTARDRAGQKTDGEADQEIERRLRLVHKEAPFARVYACPASSQDVMEELVLGLVILRPTDVFRKGGGEDSRGVARCREILETRGDAPRTYQNRLLFLAPDMDAIHDLREKTKKYLAWKSIQEESKGSNPSLILDVKQIAGVNEECRRSDEIVKRALRDTYKWILVPDVNPEEKTAAVHWQSFMSSGGSGSLISGMKNTLQNMAVVTTEWSSVLLKNLLDRWFWKNQDHIEIGQLWKTFCTYCYMERLAGYDVLESAIRQGIANGESFGYADGVENGHFVGLKNKTSLFDINSRGLLVKIEAVWKQQAEEQERKKETEKTKDVMRPGDDTTINPHPPKMPPVTPPPLVVHEKEVIKRFHLTKELDALRVNQDVRRIVEEVVQLIQEERGAKVRLTFSVDASFPQGMEEDLAKDVKENCRNLKIMDVEFDKE